MDSILVRGWYNYIKEDMKDNTKTTPITEVEEQENLLPDFSDIQEVKKAFIANEILNRKY